MSRITDAPFAVRSFSGSMAAPCSVWMKLSGRAKRSMAALPGDQRSAGSCLGVRLSEEPRVDIDRYQLNSGWNASIFAGFLDEVTNARALEPS